MKNFIEYFENHNESNQNNEDQNFEEDSNINNVIDNLEQNLNVVNREQEIHGGALSLINTTFYSRFNLTKTLYRVQMRSFAEITFDELYNYFTDFFHNLTKIFFIKFLSRLLSEKTNQLMRIIVKTKA